jgi:hypothetical protein
LPNLSLTSLNAVEAFDLVGPYGVSQNVHLFKRKSRCRERLTASLSAIIQLAPLLAGMGIGSLRQSDLGDDDHDGDDRESQVHHACLGGVGGYGIDGIDQVWVGMRTGKVTIRYM